MGSSTEPDAVKATQFITLGSGGCTEAFAPCVHAIAQIRSVVSNLLGNCSDGVRTLPKTITFRKRVFTKVSRCPYSPACADIRQIRMGYNDHLPSCVRPCDDPKRKFRCIQDRWRVTSTVQVGAQASTGQIHSIAPASLRKGDLVDVSARVTAALVRGKKGRQYEVSFEPLIIVRLTDAADVVVSIDVHLCMPVANTMTAHDAWS